MGRLLSQCVEIVSEVEGVNEGIPALAQHLLLLHIRALCYPAPTSVEHLCTPGAVGVTRAVSSFFTLSGLKTAPNFQAVGVTYVIIGKSNSCMRVSFCSRVKCAENLEGKITRKSRQESSSLTQMCLYLLKFLFLGSIFPCLSLMLCYWCQVSRAAGCSLTSITPCGSNGRAVDGKAQETLFIEGQRARRLPADSFMLWSKQGTKWSWKGSLCPLPTDP